MYAIRSYYGSAGIAGSASVYVVDIDTVGEIADAATVHSDGNVIVSAVV